VLKTEKKNEMKKKQTNEKTKWKKN
jgi:hypothetical protein